MGFFKQVQNLFLIMGIFLASISNLYAGRVLVGRGVPAITSTPIITATQASPYIYELNATDLRNAPLTWSVSSNTTLPSWLRLSSPEFKVVGTAGFSAGSIQDTSIAFDNANTPYVSYSDDGYAAKASVMKYDGTAWVNVGVAGFSTAGAKYISLAINSTGTPYVVYTDYAQGAKATVMKYDGSSWVYVGSVGLSAGSAYFNSIAFDSLDNPYVVYSDSVNGGATVKKFNGSSWVNVGSGGFSASSSDFTSIAFDSTDSPYVVYLDTAYASKATVKKYDGSSWIDVGTAGFSAGEAWYTSIALESSDSPYVVYSDFANAKKATVMKLDRTSLKLTGTPTNSDVGVHDVNLTLSDGNNTVIHNFSITVSNINDNPTASDLSFSIDENGSKTFIANEFSFSDVDTGDTLNSLFITSLPSTGTLTLNDVNVILNQEIPTANIANLKFTPQVNTYATPYDSFRFKVNDGDSNSTASYLVTMNVNKGSNDAPTITSTALTTLNEDSAYSYTLTANDVEGDSLRWSITSGSTLPSWLSLGKPDFKVVGSTGFSGGRSDDISFALDSSDIPYIVSTDYGNSGKATVMKYNGSTWVYVGASSLSQSTAYYTSIALDSTDTPYVVYKDSWNSSKSTVMKFNGTSWESVGTAGLSAGEVNYTSIALDSSDKPYVVYQDSTNSGKVTVKKFNGTSWVDVGTSGFSAGIATYTKIVLDSTDTPYVIYSDAVNNNKATVMKFNGTSWVNVGTAGFSAGSAYYTSLTLDTSDNPYVIYLDNGNSSKSTVMKFNGISWVNVGTAGFSANQAEYTSIALDSTDTPYVAYKDFSNSYKATLMKYDGTSWVDVGIASTGTADYISLALDGSDTPYVAYKDEVNDDKVTVMQLDYSSLKLTGTPTNEDVGVHDVNLTVRDETHNVSHNFEITVSNVNDTPSASDVSFTIDEDTSKTFVANDFNFMDVDVGDTLHSLFITTPPSAGTLTLNDVDVILNQEITDIVNLKFTPKINANGTPYDSFGFKVNDGDSNSTSSYTLSMNVTAIDDVPIITGTPLTSLDQDTSYSYLLNATYVDDDVLSWNASAGTTLPSWLSLSSPAFEVVGTAGFSIARADYTSIAFDSTNTPYVVYQDAGSAYKATVKKYNGSSWVNVGSSFSAGIVAYTSLAIDSTDTPYVIYRDTAKSDKATVMKFNGSSWVNVGTAGFSAGIVAYTSIAFDSADVPYVVYQDRGNSYKGTVKKFNGTSWVNVGSVGFSLDSTYYTSLVFDSSDTPYVVYKDSGSAGKATVMKFDGIIWVNVGNTGFSGSVAQYTSLAFDNSDTPYVVYQDYGNSSKATVMKFNGTSWVNLGSAGFSASAVEYTSIAFDSSDTPYVVYKDSGSTGKAMLVKYDGTSWVSVENAGFSVGEVSYVSMAFDSKDTLFIVYKDGANSNKATVMKIDTFPMLTGTPTNDDVGVYDVNLTLSYGVNNLAHNFEITVLDINDAPTASDGSLTIDEDTFKTFVANDFNFQDIDTGSSLNALFITSLSSSGILTLSDTNITLNQKVLVSDITNLKFTPTANTYGTPYDSFGFKVNDGDLNSTLAYTLSINVTGLNDAPSVTNTPLTDVKEDSEYSYVLKTNDVDNDPLSWNVSAGTTLPSWLSLSTPDFKAVGTAGFSAGVADYTSMALDSTNTPYVVYQDSANAGKATVMKFNGSAWVNVGSAGFSAGSTEFTSIAIDSADIPYIVYTDAGNNKKATVKKFNGSSWINVGTAGFSAGLAWHTSIAFDNTDIPYVIYQDAGNSDKATVKKFNGTTWVNVGSAAFSDGAVYNTSLVFTSSNTPYVGYRDAGHSNRATVKKFNGSSWVNVGAAGFSENFANYISLALDSSDTPYIVYQNYTGYGNVNKAIVMKFNGSNWDYIGSAAGFSKNTATYTSIAFDSEDSPYVVYQDYGNASRATVMKYDGTSWVNFKTPGFGAGVVYYTSIAFDSADIPYVTYKDAGNANKITVMKLDTLKLIGTPTNADVGTHDVNLTLSDGIISVSHDFEVSVSNTNDTPTSVDASFSIDEDTSKTFMANDFNFTDVDVGDALHSIFITALPSAGLLTLNDVNVTINQEISTLNIAKLIFTPQTNENGTAYSAFGFKVNDGDSNSTSSYTVTINVTSLSDSPIITSTALTSIDPMDEYSYILNASDADNDSLSWSVTSGTVLPSWLYLRTPGFNIIGSAGFSAGGARYTSMAFDSENTPYVVYQDGANSFKATLMKLNGKSWINVGGAGFSTGRADYSSLALDSKDTPYVVYKDYANAQKATVMKFNGSSWVNVGGAGFSAGTADYTSIIFDSTDTPYVVYQDGAYKGTVKKFNGTSWVDVGLPGFTKSRAMYIKIAFDSADTPYVVYQDYGVLSRVTVMKFNGSSWVNVGNRAFSDGPVYYTSIAFDSSDTPYVLYTDDINDYKATVKKFNGTSWVNVGMAGFTTGSAFETSLAIDSKDTPYITYKDSANAQKATLMKYDGSSWVVVETAGFSAGSAEYTSIVFDNLDSPYIVYRDAGNSNRATVMSLDVLRLTGIPKKTEIGIYDVNLTLSDGANSVSHNFEVTVENTNIIPTASNVSITIDEDTSKIFTANDFNFTDVNAEDSLDSLIITSLVTVGKLTLNGIDVTLNQKISASDIANLKFTPEVNMNGVPYTTFDFKVNDAYADSVLAYTATIDVTSIDDIPIITSTPLTSADQGSPYNYTLSGNDIDSDTLSWGIKAGSTSPSWLGLTTVTTIDTIAGTLGVSGNTGDGGLAVSSRLNFPRDITLDSDGNIYIADGSNHAIRKVDAITGNISTVAGVVSNQGNTGDGGLATSAKLRYPVSIKMDKQGNIYIVDSGNFTIRKIDAISGVISTIAGTLGVSGSSGDGGLATLAKLKSPKDLAVDSSGNIYIADSGNDTIRKVDASTGIISTIVGILGVSGSSGDGGLATLAQLDSPHAVTVDKHGNIYIVELALNSIRKVDVSTGIISTVAGKPGFAGSTGDGGLATSATLYYPNRVFIDESGNIYISDVYTIRKVDAISGIISTIAGTPNVHGASGDGGLATSAKVYSPRGMAMDKDGNIYIADMLNHAIRVLTTSTKLTGTPTKVDVGTHNVTLTLSDGTSTTEQNFEIKVLHLLSNLVSSEDAQDFNITLNATDTNGHSMSYVVTSSNPEIAKVSIVGSTLVVTQVTHASGVVNIELNTTANGQTVSQNFDINIASVDDVPSFTKKQGSYGVNEDSSVYSVTLEAEDIENDFFTYSASASNDKVILKLVDNKLAITPKSNANGDVTISLSVIQDNNSSLKDNYNFIVSINPVNDAPTIITSLDAITLQEDNGTSFYNFNVNDIEGDDLNISVDSNNTNILTVSPNFNGWVHQATWDNQTLDFNLTTVENAYGIVKVTVIVDDGDKNSTKSFDVNVTAVNDIPRATDVSFTIDEDTSKIFTSNDFDYVDVEDKLKSLFITRLPSAGTLTLNDINVLLNQEIIDINKLKFTPLENTNGTPYTTFGFIVNDGDVNSTSAYTATINVSPIYDIPIITSNPITTTYKGDIYSYGLTTVNDTDSNPLSWSTKEGSLLPSWLSLETTTNINTIVGTLGVSGSSGDGGLAVSAQLAYPTGVTIDSDGNIYIADTNNHIIRKVDGITGNISIIAGILGVRGASGDGGLATSAELNYPQGLTIDSNENIYVADSSNHVIRKIDSI